MSALADKSFHIIRRFLLHLFVVAALAVTSASQHAAAAPGDLYVTNPTAGVSSGSFNPGIFYKVTPNAKVTTIASVNGNTGTDNCVAFDGAGNFFTSEQGNILKYNPAGEVSTFASGLNNLAGLTFDTSGNLYAADSGTGTIYKFTPDGTKSTYASGLTQPIGLAFDSLGRLFVADASSGKIIDYHFVIGLGLVPGNFATDLNQPTFLAFDKSGNLFVSDTGSGSIFKFTSTGTKTTFASGLTQPTGLAFNSAGTLLFVVTQNAPWNPILEFDSNGLSQEFFRTFNPLPFQPFDTNGTPYAIAFEPKPHTFRNLSTRGFVGTGANVLIGGLVIGGDNVADAVVVVRARGPSLTAAGVSGALQDPTLELHDGAGNLITSNNNWKDTQQAQIQAAGYAPSDDRESVIYIALPAGNYTAVVSGVNNTTGVALVESFQLQ